MKGLILEGARVAVAPGGLVDELGLDLLHQPAVAHGRLQLGLEGVVGLARGARHGPDLLADRHHTGAVPRAGRRPLLLEPGDRGVELGHAGPGGRHHAASRVRWAGCRPQAASSSASISALAASMNSRPRSWLRGARPGSSS